MKQQVFTFNTTYGTFGLDMSEACQFAKTASQFKCAIKVSKEGESLESNGKIMMELMLLAAGKGSMLRVTADGPDESGALEAIGRLFDVFNKGWE